MDSLVRVIGPAPSELPFEQLMERVARERDRVRRSLLWFQSNIPLNKPVRAKAAKAPRAPKAPTKLATRAKKEGLSPEDIAKAIAALAAQKGVTT